MLNLLTRYWFSFDTDALPRHAGVTAYSLEDAYFLLRQELFGAGSIPQVLNIVENVDVSSLDEGHILPNIGPANFRGVWYPILNLK
jgi:hypothetical protein